MCYDLRDVTMSVVAKSYEAVAEFVSSLELFNETNFGSAVSHYTEIVPE